ncbi:MAG: NADP-dependent oxidoreductase [Acidobacteria bacterium]|nr:NADP-dependent oxidoreductase [Acidobacteriota bacterium]
MKAVRIHAFGGPEVLQIDEVETPVPQAGEVLVKVVAASVNPVDWKVRAGYLQAVFQQSFPIALGEDFAGTVAAVGADVTDVKVGDEVYGSIPVVRGGSYAEYLIAQAGDYALKPKSLDFAQAASLGVAALTAWQAFDTAGLSAGQKVLIHAAAGGVGSMAVQLAKARSAQVIGTASARNAEFVKGLGADEVIDYATTKFEDVVKDADVVFDLMGGDTQARSYGVLKRGGWLVSAAQPPDAAQLQAYGLHGQMVGMRPDKAQFEALTALIEASKVKPIVETILPLTDIRRAHELSQTGRTRGKIILTMA